MTINQIILIIYTTCILFVLFACSPVIELADHLEAEADFHAQQEYLYDLAHQSAFRPEVYADPEFLSDCEFHQMPECFN